MGKNQMSLKKMDAYIKTLRKQARNISASNDKIKKTVENMNANIYHGGKTANDWYHSADASCTSNVNFLKRLDNSIGILEKLYKKLYNAAHSNTDPLDTSTSGATAGAMASAGAVAGSALGGGTPSGNTTQATSTAKNTSTTKKEQGGKDYSYDKKAADKAMEEKKESERQAQQKVIDKQNENRDAVKQDSKSYGRGEYTPGTSKEQAKDNYYDALHNYDMVVKNANARQVNAFQGTKTSSNSAAVSQALKKVKDAAKLYESLGGNTNGGAGTRF